MCTTLVEVVISQNVPWAATVRAILEVKPLQKFENESPSAGHDVQQICSYATLQRRGYQSRQLTLLVHCMTPLKPKFVCVCSPLRAPCHLASCIDACQLSCTPSLSPHLPSSRASSRSASDICFAEMWLVPLRLVVGVLPVHQASGNSLCMYGGKLDT